MSGDMPTLPARHRSGSSAGLWLVAGLGAALCTIPSVGRADPASSGCRYQVESLMRQADAQLTASDRRNEFAAKGQQALVYAAGGDDQGCWQVAAELRQMAAANGVSLAPEPSPRADAPDASAASATPAPASASAAAPPEASETVAPVLSREVLFGVDQSALDDSAQPILREVRDAAAALPNPLILLGGHADTAGPAEHNRALSEARVDAVRSALRSLGVPAPQILSQHFGERRPEVRTGDGVAEAANRRVEIRVVRRQD